MKFKKYMLIPIIILIISIGIYIATAILQTDIILTMGVSVFHIIKNILYAVMIIATIGVLFTVILYLVYLKRRKTLNQHFDDIEDRSAKVDTIHEIITLINQTRQITADKTIKIKLDEIENEINLFNSKQKTFNELFEMKDNIDFKAEITSDLALTEKNLIGNWVNMLFIIKSIEGIYSQQSPSSGDTLYSIEKANREYDKNTKVNNEMFESLNELFVKTASSNNKISSSKLSVNNTIDAMISNDKLNDVDSVNNDMKFK